MRSRHLSARAKADPASASIGGAAEVRKAIASPEANELRSRVEVLLREKDRDALRKGVSELALYVGKLSERARGTTDLHVAAGSPGIHFDVLLGELRQVHEARTMSRAKYYLRRLRVGLGEPRPGSINDINLRRWKEYEDVWTDSLWVMGRRDSSGAHKGWYWGNFVPQIPRQMMLRYTKAGDWVLDGFTGSGTTLIECRRMGRNGIGIELNRKVALAARRLVSEEANPSGVLTEVFKGDSSTIDLKPILRRLGIRAVQLLILHPPYHDIIRFSDDPEDLSNAVDVEAFVARFSACVDNLAPFLEDGRHMALVIGDKYARGEWVPLGFSCMREVLNRGDFMLKSIIVKNFDETRGKRRQTALWRYRALAGGFYVFKHEYIFLFMKTGSREGNDRSHRRM
jgi:hypothetical protein